MVATEWAVHKLRRIGGGKKIRCKKRKKENEKKEKTHPEAAITIRHLSLHEHNVTVTQKHRTFRGRINLYPTNMENRVSS